MLLIMHEFWHFVSHYWLWIVESQKPKDENSGAKESWPHHYLLNYSRQSGMHVCACLPDAKHVLNTGSWSWEMVRWGEQQSLQQNSGAEAQLWNNPLWVQWELTQLSTDRNQALNTCRTKRDVCRRVCLRISYLILISEHSEIWRIVLWNVAGQWTREVLLPGAHNRNQRESILKRLQQDRL